MHSRFDSCPARFIFTNMIFLNNINQTTIPELTLQSLPSTVNLVNFQRLLQIFNETFLLEGLPLSNFTTSLHNVSEGSADVLFMIGAAGGELVSVLFCTLLVFIFSLLYSIDSNTVLSQKISKILNTALAMYFIYVVSFYVVCFSYGFNLCEQTVTNLATNVFVLSLFVIVLNLINISKTAVYNPEVPILIFLVACFSWSLTEVNNFGLFIICLEGFSLTLYILATTKRTYGGVSAAVKYFIFGTLGSVLLYWGSLSIFELTATMSIDGIKEFIENSRDWNNNTINAGLLWTQIFIILGFLIKLGAAPTHQWVVDVYSGVSLSVTLFYATFVKAVLFLLFLQFAVILIEAKEVEYAAVLSIVVGCFGALRQVEIKRFLAYSSITHTGYLLMGDLIASYVYLITYLLASFLFFSVLLNTKLNNKELLYLADLRFIGQSSQLHRAALVVSLASMAGLPPFAGFYGKMAVWISLIEDIYLFNDSWSYILFLVAILTSLISMFYYAQVMCTLFVNNEEVNSKLVFSTIIVGLWFYIILITAWTITMPTVLDLVTTLYN